MRVNCWLVILGTKASNEWVIFPVAVFTYWPSCRRDMASWWWHKSETYGTRNRPTRNTKQQHISLFFLSTVTKFHYSTFHGNLSRWRGSGPFSDCVVVVRTSSLFCAVHLTLGCFKTVNVRTVRVLRWKVQQFSRRMCDVEKVCILCCMKRWIAFVSCSL